MSKRNTVSKKGNIWHRVYSDRALYLLLLPSFIIMFIFTYLPMYGVVIAFKDFTPAKGIMGSSWAGLKYFKQYFNSFQFWPTIKNTLILSIYRIQMPNVMGLPSAFPSVYVWTEVWQHLGWDSILYIAALAAIDPSLYEAATMDGASKWQKMLKIDIPLLMPTATVMFILRMGSVMNVGFEKVYLLQNNLNTASSEIISTYVYKMGLVSSQYSLSSAIGLFNNLINLVLLVTVNYISKKMSDTSLV